jgi:surfeit locus 1 family protein
VWPTLLSLAGLAVLVSLGNWQMSRKAWKDGLSASIAERTRAEPVPAAVAVARMKEGADVEYTRVVAKGRFLHEHERRLYAPDQKLGPGYHIYTPMLLADGSGIVLVNRGYVSDAIADGAKREKGQIAGEVSVVGLARRSAEKGAFTPDNDVKRNIWYWRDIAGFAASLPAELAAKVLPLAVDAEAMPENPGGWPRGGVTEVKLANRHLEYALTWYGLAATLLAVFAAFARGRLRSQT